MRLLLLLSLLIASPEAYSQSWLNKSDESGEGIGNISDEKFRQTDSLFTYAYVKHRIYKSFEKFSIPAAVKRKLTATAAIADSLASRVKGTDLGAYQYLIKWTQNPLLTENEARGLQSATIRNKIDCYPACLGDTDGYAHFQQQITTWRQLAYQHQQANNYQQSIRYRDSVFRLFPFALTDISKAKRLAVKARDTAAYLGLFGRDPYQSFSMEADRDMGWSVAASADDKAFVQASLAKLDTAGRQTRDESICLRLLANRFERLQESSSLAIMNTYSPVTLMLQNKSKLRELYCFLVEETYTSLPNEFCRHLSAGDSIAPQSLASFNYFGLHLVQLNSFGRIYPTELFENYFNFLHCLAYHRLYDMETVATYYDWYLTAVLHQETKFGAVLQPGSFGKELHKETAAARENRHRYHLVPVAQSAVE